MINGWGKNEENLLDIFKFTIPGEHLQVYIVISLNLPGYFLEIILIKIFVTYPHLSHPILEPGYFFLSR